MTDTIGIVHLTDLHWPEIDRPIWADPLLMALQGVGQDSTVRIAGLAVTGDLVDSPSECAFANVAVFLAEAARLLNMPGRPMERVWIIDGNHDYRRKGTFGRVNGAGIELGNRLIRHHLSFDQEHGLLVAGLNSSASGALARGIVSHRALQDIERRISSMEVGQARFRIALVHHHLLTMPSEPIDPRSRGQRFRAIIYDEATKLLENAGLLARRLLDMQFDLVLHGHEHQRFAATFSRVDGEANRSMAILGGTSADQGFGLVLLKSSGEVVFQSFAYSEAAYRRASPNTLWTVEDWRRLEWQRASSQSGWYDRYSATQSADFSGDAQQSVEVTAINAARGRTIDAIDVRIRSAELGTAIIDNFLDKKANRHLTDTPAPGSPLSYPFRLNPPAIEGAPHPGYLFASRVLNTFAVSDWDARQRGLTTAEEHTGVRAPFPVRRITLRFRFPSGRVPETVWVNAYKGASRTVEINATPPPPDPIDPGETERAMSRLLFESSVGLAILDLEWVLPRYRYELRWRLPAPEPAPAVEADMAERHTRWLLALPRSDEHPLDLTFRRLRDAVCRDQLDQPDSADIHLSLLVFDPDSNAMRVVCSTYEPNNPLLNVRLSWGDGVAGLAMRRRRPCFVDVQNRKHSGIYRSVPGCPAERYLLCVPIPIPWDGARRGRTELHPSLPPAVLTMASVSNSAMQRLGDDSLCLNISSRLAEAVLVALDRERGSGMS